VALKHSHVIERRLPPGGHIDEKNNQPSQRPKKERFRSKYGDYTYELEALAPDDMRQILDDAICSVLDIEAYNYEVEREQEEASFLDEQRQRMRLALDM
jgi:hypothetical protein